MKLALFSYIIPEKAAEKMSKMVGKKPAEMTVVYLTTAANVYDKYDADWLWDTYDQLKKHFAYVEEFDVEEHAQKQQQFFKDYFQDKDLIFISGGNVFYLNYWMKKTGAEEALENLVTDDDVVYAGASAGAVYPMHDIEIFKLIDDPTEAPELVNRGMGIVDFAVLPHWGEEKFMDALKKIKKHYTKKTVETYELYNDEALIVEDDEIHKV